MYRKYPRQQGGHKLFWFWQGRRGGEAWPRILSGGFDPRSQGDSHPLTRGTRPVPATFPSPVARGDFLKANAAPFEVRTDFHSRKALKCRWIFRIAAERLEDRQRGLAPICSIFAGVMVIFADRKVSCSLSSLQAAENFNASAFFCGLPALSENVPRRIACHHGSRYWQRPTWYITFVVIAVGECWLAC